MSNEQHSRTILLLGEDKFMKLQNSHVLIVGLGGVGGYAAEQLARAGIGRLSLIDADVVSESNLNRQIIALNSTIGKDKIYVLSERLKDINSEIIVEAQKVFISAENINEIIKVNSFDYVIDAIDTLQPKVELIKACLKYKIPIISSMGAGGRRNPEKVHVSDIKKTYNCGLARKLRKKLHRAGIRTGFKAVFSSEQLDKDSLVIEESRNKKSNSGTISYMPSIFGIYCSSVVLNGLVEQT